MVNTRNMKKNLLNINDIQEKSALVSIDDRNYITYTLNNSSGSSNVFANLFFNVDKNIVKGQTYYIIVEVKSVSGTGVMYINHYNSSSMPKVQFSTSIRINLSELQSNKKYLYPVVANSATTIIQGLRSYLQCGAGQSASITCRYSILKNNVTNLDNFVYEPHQGKELPLDLGSIELCKIGDYQDYFYKSGSKWYLHKETLKIIIPSSVNGVMQNSDKRFFVNKTKLNNCDILHTPYGGQTYGLYCDILKEVTAGQTWSGTQGISYDYNETPGSGGLDFTINGLTTVAEYQEALEGKIIVARLNTPTNTEITDTTLISQLEAIYNVPLYEQTNITQTNNDLPIVLDITACKDNINGIKAFIRK